MRVAVTGGRDYKNKIKVFETLDNLLFRNPNFTLVVGDATGADAYAQVWAQKKNIPVEIFKADWAYYGRSAGPIRNRQMVDSGVDLLVAFSGGIGTDNMTTLCQQAHVKIMKISN